MMLEIQHQLYFSNSKLYSAYKYNCTPQIQWNHLLKTHSVGVQTYAMSAIQQKCVFVGINNVLGKLSLIDHLLV